MISFKQYIEIAEKNYFSCLMSQNCNTIQIYANDEITLLQDTTDYFYVEYLFSQNETFRLTETFRIITDLAPNRDSELYIRQLEAEYFEEPEKDYKAPNAPFAPYPPL
jgi:hypothetical protein